MKLLHAHGVLKEPSARRGLAEGCTLWMQPCSVLVHHSVLPLSPDLAQHSHRYQNKQDLRALIPDAIQCTELGV